MAIPKKLFQTARSFEELPIEYKEHISKLRALNPDWEYNFFNDEGMKSYIREHTSLDDWNQLECVNPKYGVVLADLFRYLIIYNEGGVYLDIKSRSQRSLTDTIDLGAHFILSQWPNRIGERYAGYGLHAELFGVPGGEFQQWCIIAEPRHAFLRAAVVRVLRNIRDYTPSQFGSDAMGVLRVSGPIAYTKAIYPILHHYPHTVVSFDTYGIQYSLYQETGNQQAHQTKMPGHYSSIKEPIVLRDLYVEPPQSRVVSLGELLARELRENVDLVLKLAVVSIVATITMLLAFLVLLAYLVGAH